MSENPAFNWPLLGIGNEHVSAGKVILRAKPSWTVFESHRPHLPLNCSLSIAAVQLAFLVQGCVRTDPTESRSKR
eukprot:scaffold1739_cov109-Cylindrotheca_fusiformis.AAC.10